MKPAASAVDQRWPQSPDECMADERLPDFWPLRQHSQFISVGEQAWHLQRMGQGAPLLLLHGTGSSCHTWHRLIPRLVDSHDVIAVDLPGHGYSGSIAGGRMTLASISAEVNALLQHLGVEPHTIIGHSAGAAVAIEVGQSANDRLVQLVGINAALFPFGGVFARLFSPLAQLAAIVPFLPGLVRRMAADPDMVQRMIENTGSVLNQQDILLYRHLLQSESHIRATMKMMADWDLQSLFDRLAPLAERLHLIVAEKDIAVDPGEARKVCRRYPAVSCSELAGLGHLAHEEDPERVLLALDDILQRAVNQ